MMHTPHCPPPTRRYARTHVTNMHTHVIRRAVTYFFGGPSCVEHFVMTDGPAPKRPRFGNHECQSPIIPPHQRRQPTPEKKTNLLRITIAASNQSSFMVLGQFGKSCHSSLGSSTSDYRRTTNEMTFHKRTSTKLPMKSALCWTIDTDYQHASRTPHANDQKTDNELTTIQWRSYHKFQMTKKRNTN